jgi:hypothetical protein
LGNSWHFLNLIDLFLDDVLANLILQLHCRTMDNRANLVFNLLNPFFDSFRDCLDHRVRLALYIFEYTLGVLFLGGLLILLEDQDLN